MTVFYGNAIENEGNLPVNKTLRGCQMSNV